MARQRFENTALKTWDDADLHMKEIQELTLKVEAIEADMTARISDVKLEAELKVKPLAERIKRLGLEIKEFAELNRDEIKGKTRRLTFGQLGFRQSTRIMIKNTKAVLAALKARGMTNCIKVAETILKDELAKYTEPEIVAVGALKKVDDVFWIEVDHERVSEGGQA